MFLQIKEENESCLDWRTSHPSHLNFKDALLLVCWLLCPSEGLSPLLNLCEYLKMVFGHFLTFIDQITTKSRVFFGQVKFIKRWNSKAFCSLWDFWLWFEAYFNISYIVTDIKTTTELEQLETLSFWLHYHHHLIFIMDFLSSLSCSAVLRVSLRGSGSSSISAAKKYRFTSFLYLTINMILIHYYSYTVPT